MIAGNSQFIHNAISLTSLPPRHSVNAYWRSREAPAERGAFCSPQARQGLVKKFLKKVLTGKEVCGIIAKPSRTGEKKRKPERERLKISKVFEESENKG